MSKIIIPPKETKKIKCWFHKYPKLSSALFTWENSGQKLNSIPPYSEIRDDDYAVIDIEPNKYVTCEYSILGYAIEPIPKIEPTYPAVAIMFEHKETFEKLWWHFRRSDIEYTKAYFKED